MSKGKKVILVVVAVFIATVILFLMEKNRVNTDSADNPAVEIQKKQKVKEKIVSNLNTALRKSLRQAAPEEMEKVFNLKFFLYL